MSIAPSQSDIWTTRFLLDWIREALDKAQIDSPRLCAELLVSNVIGCERLNLYTDADRPASQNERDRLRELVSRALRHEPVQYLTQTAWFFSMPFYVDSRVLIPRPSSETLVEVALEFARTLDEPPRIADVCTGSGCIALSLLSNLPQASAIATDIDPKALEVASQNASSHKLEARIELKQGQTLEPLNELPPFDIIVSNPPYIPDHEWDDVEDNVKLHEPTHALRAGADGLNIIKPILDGAPQYLKPGAMLALEVASVHASTVLDMLNEHESFTQCSLHKDIDGLDRVIVAQRAHESF